MTFISYRASVGDSIDSLVYILKWRRVQMVRLGRPGLIKWGCGGTPIIARCAVSGYPDHGREDAYIVGDGRLNR